MDNPQGQVVSISGTDPHRRALIAVNAFEVCPRCAAGKGCGAGLFGRGERTRRIEASVPRGACIATGDRVRIALEPQSVLHAAFVVYGWPLCGAAAGALLAYLAAYGDAAAAAAALAGLALGALLARRRLRQSRCLQQFTPRVLA